MTFQQMCAKFSSTGGAAQTKVAHRLRDICRQYQDDDPLGADLTGEVKGEIYAVEDL